MTKKETKKVKRYIVGHRTGPKLDPQSVRTLDDFVSSRAEANVVKETEVGRKVVEMTEDQKKELEQTNPQFIIEEDHDLKMFPMPGIPDVVPATSAASGSFTLDVVVRDNETGKPVPEVTIFALGQSAAYKAKTNKQGAAKLQANEQFFQRVIASPRDTYWSRVTEEVTAGESSPLEFRLNRLRVNGAYDWGHRLMGFDRVNRVWTGRDIKIAVIDSGITDQFDYLRPAGGLNTLDDQKEDTWNVDDEGHGTFCGGVIACQHSPKAVLGGAPNAKIYSVKVFPGGRVSDLMQAVEWCIINKMDVISMSLGSSEPSQNLANVIQDAYNRGITCIAAAGNDSSHVAFPAAFPTVIAVSAIGSFGTFPEDSGHSLKVGNSRDWYGRLFSANFTNFGPEVDVCAPGVAILSTVPNGFVAWDGTSFSCPLVSALAALIIEAYPSVRTGNSLQPEYVRSIIHGSSINLGMPPLIQGKGMPNAVRALAAARPAARPAAWSQPQGLNQGMLGYAGW